MYYKAQCRPYDRIFINDAPSSSNSEPPEQKSHMRQNHRLCHIWSFHCGFIEDLDLLRCDTASTETSWTQWHIHKSTRFINKELRHSANCYWNKICEHSSLNFSELLLSLSKEIVPRNVHVSVCLSLQTTFKPSEPEFMQLQCRSYKTS